jgi:hypothetical protein
VSKNKIQNPPITKEKVEKDISIDSDTISVPIIFKDNLVYIEILTDLAIEKKLIILLDSGACLSLIKENKVPKGYIFINKNSEKISGVCDTSFKTQGLLSTICRFSKKNLPLFFHVAQDHVLPENIDGILGLDFLKFTTLDLINNKLIFKNSMSYFSNKRKKQTYLIKENSISYYNAFLNISDGDYLIKKNIINEFLIIPNSMVKVKEGKCTLKMLNLSDKKVEFKVSMLNKLNIEKYNEDQFNCLTLNKNNNKNIYNIDRNTLIRENLKLNHCSSIKI